jgi:hypothetical protein
VRIARYAIFRGEAHVSYDSRHLAKITAGAVTEAALGNALRRASGLGRAHVRRPC